MMSPSTHAKPSMSRHDSLYLRTFCVLIALTAVTLIVYCSLPHSDQLLVRVLVATIIAWIKVIIVAMFFMHLRFERRLIYIIVGVPLILCVVLIAGLVPDVHMTWPTSDSASMHLFNDYMGPYNKKASR